MKNKQIIIGALAVIFAAIMWGFDGVVLTPRLFNLEVPFVVFVLHALPFLIMLTVLPTQLKKLAHFSKSDYLFFLLIALFGGILGTTAIVKALFLVNFKALSIVVLLQKLQPVFSILLAVIILKEKIRKRFTIWASLAIIASYFLVFGTTLPNFETGENTIYAAGFALLAAFSFGSSTVFSKKVLGKYSFATATFYRYGFTTLLLFIFVLISGKITLFGEVTQTNWIYFMIIAFTTGSGAIFLYYYGLIRIRAILATICELFFPASAIVLDYVFNGKVLSPAQWIAALVLIFAIVKLTTPPKK